MKAATHLFIEDLKSFSKESIGWCITESEQASSNIAIAIDVLLQDAERVSALSQESLDAITLLRTESHVSPSEGSQKADAKIGNLVNGLKALCSEHDEVRNIIDPILQALQFQDRMKQNLDNLMKMLDIWLDYREKLSREAAGFSEDHEKAFGKALYDCTAMSEERDLIKKSFPLSDRPREGSGKSVEFF